MKSEIPNWLVVEPTHLKNMSQIGNLHQLGMNIKYIWVATTQQRVVAFLMLKKKRRKKLGIQGATAKVSRIGSKQATGETWGSILRTARLPWKKKISPEQLCWEFLTWEMTWRIKSKKEHGKSRLKIEKLKMEYHWNETYWNTTVNKKSKHEDEIDFEAQTKFIHNQIHVTIIATRH